MQDLTWSLRFYCPTIEITMPCYNHMVISGKVTPKDESRYPQCKYFLAPETYCPLIQIQPFTAGLSRFLRMRTRCVETPQSPELHFFLGELLLLLENSATPSVWLTLASCLASQGYLPAHLTHVPPQSFRNSFSR